MSVRNIDAVLFDLDGTLLDTAGDMAAALNVVLARHDRPTLSHSEVRPHVSKGGMALVELGFGAGFVPRFGRDDDAAISIYRELLDAYQKNISAHTRLFPGIATLLAHLEDKNRRCGVVTNKPGFLTEPLLDEMQLRTRIGCVVSGDTLAEKKPHPLPLLHACNLLDIDVARAVYVGDDSRDIEAGRRAGMRTIAAAYGYILADDDPHTWGADLVVDHPDEIRAWLAGESDLHGVAR